MPHSKTKIAPVPACPLNETGEFSGANCLLESLKCGIYRADAKGNLTYANQSLAQIFGYSDKKELLGLNVAKHFYSDARDRETFLEKLKEKGYLVDYEIRTVRKDGKIITVSATSDYVLDQEGYIIGVEGAVEDVTERKRLEEDLRFEKQKLEQILSVEQKISSILELDHLVDFVIEKAVEILGARRCSIMFIDHDTKELVVKGAKGLSDEAIKEVRVKLGDPVAGLVAKEGMPLLVANIESEGFVSRKNRPSYKTKSFLSVPIKLNDRLVGVVNVSDKDSNGSEVFTPIDLKILCAIVRQAAVAIENATLYKEMKYLSITDSLTKLYNHRHFTKSLDQEIGRIKRYSETLSLMIIDIDNFKSFNDQQGHLAGDTLLREFGKILSDSLREIDIPCRYGGDEFAVILPGIDSAEAKIVAEKIKKIFARISFKGQTTLSIGIASCARDMDRYDFILKADQALYRAKKLGKDRLCIYE